EGAAEEFEQYFGGQVLPEESVLETARKDRSHRCGDETVDLGWVAFDLFAGEDGVAVADCRQGAHDSLDRLFHWGAFEAGVSEASGGLGEGVGSECVEQCFPVGVVAVQRGTADAGCRCEIGHTRATTVV